MRKGGRKDSLLHQTGGSLDERDLARCQISGLRNRLLLLVTICERKPPTFVCSSVAIYSKPARQQTFIFKVKHSHPRNQRMGILLWSISDCILCFPSRWIRGSIHALHAPKLYSPPLHPRRSYLRVLWCHETPFLVLVATDRFGYPLRKFPLAEFHCPIQPQPGPAPSRFLAIPDMAAAAPDPLQSHPRSWPCLIGTRGVGKYHPKWEISSNFPSSPKGSGGPSSQKHNGSSRRQRRLSLGLSQAAATRYWKLMPAPYRPKLLSLSSARFREWPSLSRLPPECPVTAGALKEQQERTGGFSLRAPSGLSPGRLWTSGS